MRTPLLAMLVLSAAAHGQPLERLWLRQFGTAQPDEAHVVTIGGFVGDTLVGGGTQGSLFGANAGMTDAFWARDGQCPACAQWGSAGSDVVLAMTGVSSELFSGGYTDGNLFGPSAGATDAFVRLDGHTSAWTIQFGTPAADSVRGLSPSSGLFGESGAIAVGTTRGSLGGPSAGGEDAWVALLSEHDQRVWTRQFGSAADDVALAVAPAGVAAYVVGYTAGALAGPNAGSLDAFVALHDWDAGDQLWLRQFGTSSYDQAVAAAPDGAGGVYVAGGTGGALGGPSAGSRDAFIARFDSSGVRLWTRQFGTNTFDDIAALCPDGEGGVYAGGYTLGSLAGPNAGARDAFVARYNAAGEGTALVQFGTPGDDSVGGMAAAGSGSFYIAGSTLGTLGASAFGGSDAWVALYRVGCDADVNADGNVDQDDVICMINTVAGNVGCAAQDADFNRDGNVDQDDVIAVITAVAGGGCP